MKEGRGGRDKDEMERGRKEAAMLLCRGIITKHLKRRENICGYTR